MNSLNDFIDRLNKFISELETVHGFKFSDTYKQKIFKLNMQKLQGKGSRSYQGFGIPCSMCLGEINPNSVVPDKISQTFIGPECFKKLQFMRVNKKLGSCSNMFGDCIGCGYLNKIKPNSKPQEFICPHRQRAREIK